jgi:hypothetical protein
MNKVASSHFQFLANQPLWVGLAFRTGAGTADCGIRLGCVFMAFSLSSAPDFASLTLGTDITRKSAVKGLTWTNYFSLVSG